MSDCLIVGGGVVGLSLAYELAGHGWQVRVLDAGEPGRETSWAGAGILPPASPLSLDPLDQLTALSNEMHRHWSEELLARTGIDNGYGHTGALYLAREPLEALRLEQFAQAAVDQQIAVERLSLCELAEIEPTLHPRTSFEAAYLVRDECQLRNPRHLKALIAACLQRGVELTACAAAEDFEVRNGFVRSVRTRCGDFAADQICLTSGSWTSLVARKLGLKLPIKPIRGQIVLVRSERPIVRHIVKEGRCYLVPRFDGRLLVGSTEEDVGFNTTTTAGVTSVLLQFAFSLVPHLATSEVERSWAGLRPATADGRPYLGRVPGLENAFVASGHFRSGLQLSTGTALVMSQCIRGERPETDLSSFALDREVPADSNGDVVRSVPPELYVI